MQRFVFAGHLMKIMNYDLGFVHLVFSPVNTQEFYCLFFLRKEYFGDHAAGAPAPAGFNIAERRMKDFVIGLQFGMLLSAKGLKGLS